MSLLRNIKKLVYPWKKKCKTTKSRFHTSPTETKLANSSSLLELWHFCEGSGSHQSDCQTKSCGSHSRLFIKHRNIIISDYQWQSITSSNKDSLKQQPPPSDNGVVKPPQDCLMHHGSPHKKPMCPKKSDGFKINF